MGAALWITLAGLAAFGLPACADDPSSDGGADAPTTEASTAAPDDTPALALTDMELDLESPIALTEVPGTTSVLIAERAGRVREAVVSEGGLELVDDPVIDITSEVGDAEGERGLLGIAVDPDGATLYASYTAAEDGASTLDAYPLGGSAGSLQASVDDRRELLSVQQPFPNHNGGHVEFGPDELIYLGLGDGGSSGDPEGRAQDRTTLLGKILRLDPHRDDEIAAADNPFESASADGEERPEIWLTGVRNPWGFSFDRATGDLWIADVGQDTYEEINVLRATGGGGGGGANLGWDLYEGDAAFDDADPAPGAASEGPFTEPIFTYGRDRGCSITGGVVYRGTAVPDLVGSYLFADYCIPGLRGLAGVADDSADPVELDLDQELTTIVGFGEDGGGEVYVLSIDSGVYRIEAP